MGVVRYMHPTIYICLLLVAVFSSSASAKGLDEVFKKSEETKTPLELFKSVTNISSGMEKSYALVVGISVYDNYTNLPTSENPIAVKDYLLRAGYNEVHLLTEDRVTKKRLEELMLDYYPSKMDDNDRFLLYWSGHGVDKPNGIGGQSGFLPVRNSTKDRSSMVTMDSLRYWEKNLPSKHILFILDACFSGLAAVAPLSNAKRITKRQMLNPARFIITAGKSGEETIASEEWKGSVFTYALLKGLEGAADRIANDGVVSLFELVAYIKSTVHYERIRMGWGSEITPQVRFMRHSDGEYFFPVISNNTVHDQIYDDKKSTVVKQSSEKNISKIPWYEGFLITNQKFDCNEYNGDVIVVKGTVRIYPQDAEVLIGCKKIVFEEDSKIETESDIRIVTENLEGSVYIESVVDETNDINPEVAVGVRGRGGKNILLAAERMTPGATFVIRSNGSNGGNGKSIGGDGGDGGDIIISISSGYNPDSVFTDLRNEGGSGGHGDAKRGKDGYAGRQSTGFHLMSADDLEKKLFGF